MNTITITKQKDGRMRFITKSPFFTEGLFEHVVIRYNEYTQVLTITIPTLDYNHKQYKLYKKFNNIVFYAMMDIPQGTFELEIENDKVEVECKTHQNT